MTFAIGPWEKRKPDIDAWRELYEKEWNRKAPPSVANVIAYCDTDASRAHDVAHKHMAEYWNTATAHSAVISGSL